MFISQHHHPLIGDIRSSLVSPLILRWFFVDSPFTVHASFAPQQIPNRHSPSGSPLKRRGRKPMTVFGPALLKQPAAAFNRRGTAQLEKETLKATQELPESY
ncbi:hypothetical protein [Bifidobacterium sp. ESL0790]|uniref:hypothetical protein n=1 Tax=Bifidobacterium sp. ESL0790 TaxID=2983233 RepID=UPI0023F674B2|nr:hypothetical protein [Bifidobacterium sp. ESL0790]WEV72021.1 hypothetical protein OZY47_06120 [Bifidobacterium sp. ESL0790]